MTEIAKNEPNVSPMLYAGRKEKAEVILNAFKELEQYRALGTVEELKNGAFTWLELVQISVHLAELEEYKALGTVEELREAREKQVAKKPIRNDLCTCPRCGTHNETIKKRRNTVNYGENNKYIIEVNHQKPIGTYSTEEKGIKVLDMIQEAYENSCYCDAGYDSAAHIERPYLFMNNRVFQMPQDGGVEV